MFPLSAWRKQKRHNFHPHSGFQSACQSIPHFRQYRLQYFSQNPEPLHGWRSSPFLPQSKCWSLNGCHTRPVGDKLGLPHELGQEITLKWRKDLNSGEYTIFGSWWRHKLCWGKEIHGIGQYPLKFAPLPVPDFCRCKGSGEASPYQKPAHFPTVPPDRCHRLSLIGIPIGLVIGYLLGAVLVPVMITGVTGEARTALIDASTFPMNKGFWYPGHTCHSSRISIPIARQDKIAYGIFSAV